MRRSLCCWWIVQKELDLSCRECGFLKGPFVEKGVKKMFAAQGVHTFLSSGHEEAVWIQEEVFSLYRQERAISYPLYLARRCIPRQPSLPSRFATLAIYAPSTKATVLTSPESADLFYVRMNALNLLRSYSFHDQKRICRPAREVGQTKSSYAVCFPPFAPTSESDFCWVQLCLRLQGRGQSSAARTLGHDEQPACQPHSPKEEIITAAPFLRCSAYDLCLAGSLSCSPG